MICCFFICEEGDVILSGAGARLRQDARAEPLPGCRESSRSGPGGKPGRSRTRSGLVKGETYCGVKGQRPLVRQG